METATQREWLPGMGEISGFGGGYEDACRAMLFAGMEWLDQHPAADLVFTEYKNIYGLVNSKTADAEALEKACLAVNDGCSGAQMHAVLSHLMFIRKNGWDAYCAEMTKREAEGDKA